MGQFDTSRFSKFGVQGKYLDGEGYLVGHSLAGAMATGKEFQVFKAIVLSFAVYVVNSFVFAELAAKVLFHNIAVLKNSPFSTSYARRDAYPSVAALYVAFYVAGLKPRGGLIDLVGNFTVVVAKVLSVINATARFTCSGLQFTALLAREILPLIRILAAAIVAAWHGAIQRIFIPFPSVCRQVGRFHAELFSTISASKRNFRHAWSASHGRLLRLFVGNVACAVN